MDVVNLAFSFPFSNEHDVVRWAWHRKGFTSKSIYDKLRASPRVCHILLGISCVLSTSKKICQVKKELISNSLSLHVIFVPILKQLDHLFFQCSITKVVWGIFGICLGANNTPHEVGHYRAWVNFWLPGGAGAHLVFCCNLLGNLEIPK